MLLILISLICFGQVLATDDNFLSDDTAEVTFVEYIYKFKKSYKIGSDEYFSRFEVFKNSLNRINWLNLQRDHPKSALYGLTKFSDMTPEEFRATILTSSDSRNVRPSSSSTSRRHHHRDHHHRHHRAKRHVYVNDLLPQLPHNFPRHADWREKGVITQVHNQGKCGACWAFSTVETVEAMVAIRLGEPATELSVQQIIDCANDNNHGCNGGDTCTALQWMSENRIKIQRLADYPMTAGAQECRSLDPPTGIVVSNYTCNDFITDEKQILRELAYHGPLAAAVDATSWQDYLGGVIQFHCETNKNHAVQIVGFDLTGEVPYYIVRNTWGTSFGIDGYLHIAIGKNLCAIAEEVSSLDIINFSGN
ncbi:Cathepsin O [Halotydeus destructor]|nr:Cathepsin O [Halotydeus destructor]